MAVSVLASNKQCGQLKHAYTKCVTRAQQKLKWETVWPQQTWAKHWGAVPLFEGGSWAKSNTMSPGQRPTTVPSRILIHPAVCPQ